MPYIPKRYTQITGVFKIWAAPQTGITSRKRTGSAAFSPNAYNRSFLFHFFCFLLKIVAFLLSSVVQTEFRQGLHLLHGSYPAAISSSLLPENAALFSGDICATLEQDGR